ncbi:MAG: hypothetical protein ABJE47_23315 [bacterium]
MTRFQLQLLAALLMVTPTAVDAQGVVVQSKASIQSDCRVAANVVSTGDPSGKRAWAHGVIRRCPQAEDAIASAWKRSLSDTELKERENVSALMLDRRVLNAALSGLTSTTRPLEERRSALAVLTALYAPGRMLTMHFWDDPANTSLAHVMDWSPQPGAQTITVADRQRVLAALEEIATTDPSPKLRTVTTALVKQLKRATPK